MTAVVVVVVDSIDPKYETSGNQENKSEPSNSGFLKFRLNVFIFLLIYTLAGAWIFQLLERVPEVERQRIFQDALTSTRKILLKTLDNFTDFRPNSKSTELLATKQALENYEKAIDLIFKGDLKSYLGELDEINKKWGPFVNCYLFVLILLSTIGYGNIAPETTGGRIFCIFYSVIGIPTMLIFIAQAGSLLAHLFHRLYSKVFRNRGHYGKFVLWTQSTSRMKRLLSTIIFICGVVVLIFGYISIGAFLFDMTESWGFINSFYFCFITMTTIGFGDLIPHKEHMGQSDPIITTTRSIYLFFGLAITSMAIALVQNHYSVTWSKPKSGGVQTNSVYNK